ncbi:MAG: hydrogenase maturation protein [Gammaproteobacteria bacterium]|nr:hydrogenase maturation protein [Gammaproteobacteria bacterium]
MRILLLTHSFNNLSQRLYAELAAAGHEVSVEFDINDAVSIEAVRLWRPELIIAPFLKRAIPEQIWRKHVCLIVHPGIPGDRGPSALDWAILDGEQSWGVTVLQAEQQLDAGPVWAWCGFPMRLARKSSLYRHEVTDAAVSAALEAVDKFKTHTYTPLPSSGCGANRLGQARARMRQADRRIDWQHDDTETVLRKLYAGDGDPGVADRLLDMNVRLFDARPEFALRGTPGDLIARSEEAVCRATRDGAVWIGRLKAVIPGKHSLKLPATRVLQKNRLALEALPEVHGPAADYTDGIRYEEHGNCGYLYFDFYNGAMSTAQCQRLLEAYRRARQRPTKVVVLMGGEDFWCNGMNLTNIEAAASPAEESWHNINAMDDLCRAIITTDDHLTVAAMGGNAAAGGVFLALAADRIYARHGTVFNPHYKNMGNLYGSEYWTYLLPRRVGDDGVPRIMNHRLPLLAKQAMGIGLIDECLAGDNRQFLADIESLVKELAADDVFQPLLEAKRKRLAADAVLRPLQTYRDEELRHMRLNFYGFDPSYHVARYKFVYRVPHAWTPLHLARHRQLKKLPVSRSQPALHAVVAE